MSGAKGQKLTRSEKKRAATTAAKQPNRNGNLPAVGPPIDPLINLRGPEWDGRANTQGANGVSVTVTAPQTDVNDTTKPVTQSEGESTMSIPADSTQDTDATVGSDVKTKMCSFLHNALAALAAGFMKPAGTVPVVGTHVPACARNIPTGVIAVGGTALAGTGIYLYKTWQKNRAAKRA